MKPVSLLLGMAGAALSLGGLIYLTLRLPTLLMFDWFDALGLLAPIQHLRVLAAPWSDFFPDWVVYSVPTGLWAFSFLLLIGAVWQHDSRFFRAYAVPLTFAIVGSELLQMGPLQGTFDWNDLAANVLGIITAWGIRNAIYTHRLSTRTDIDRRRRLRCSRSRIVG